MSNIRPKLTAGSVAPNFESNSASGPLKFHQWIGEHWSIVFSHPGSSFPSDLTEVARRLADIEQRNIKIVGFSRNWSNESNHWNKLLQHYSRQPGSGKDVQIIADDQGRMSSLYGMLPERNSKGVPSNPNTAFLIDPMKVIRSVLAYPSSLSTGLSQLLRFVDDNSGPLEDIPTEMFGLDAKGRGKIYDGEVTVSNGGSGATVGVVQAAAGVIGQVKDASSGGDSPSSNVVATATDYIQHAMTVMDTLSDIGKVMPFVAPAFVIIKTIIAIEQRARDVDAKCTDLVQRVTFMLSHLPALKKIQVTDATRQVIDRMNDTLKKAAALIQTYRKQGAIARRLSVHNKDRFASCASSLKECTNDLMISLQIHQSTQLDILTRPIPSDPEDEAAEKFVASHGGIDAVKGNEELVKQFASEMKLSVDDKVMEQLNTNLSAVLQENQDRLEKSLNESVSASVVEGIRSLATQMNESAKEQTFICVQCDKEYRESTSGEKSCSFHRAEYDSWKKSHDCCGSKNPCQVGRHRSEHHCDYPYGNFFPFARNITGYVDTVEQWVEVEDLNLETSDKLRASVGRLLRWKSRGAVPDLPTILIRVGTVSISKPYLFKTFNTKDLEVVSQVVDITHQTVIFRSSHSKEEFAMAEWVLSPNGGVGGIRITVKSSTSPKPFIRLCPIDIATCTLSGEVRSLSEGGLRAYKPSTPYVLPEMQRVSASLHEGASRATRTFKARTSPNLPVVLKSASDPPLVANEQFASSNEQDNFSGTVSLFNKHLANSMQPISIASVTAFYRFAGEKEYRPVKSLELLDGMALPVSVDPRHTCTFKFKIAVPRSDEDKKVPSRWFGRAFTARQRPLRIKLVLTDIEDEECSLVLDYVSPTPELQTQRADDLAMISVEEPFTWSRYGITVSKDSSGALKIGSGSTTYTLNEDWMQTTVYKALRSGDSEIELDIGQDEEPGTPKSWSWKTWALVDLSCQRLYAFKILVTKDIVGTKGYACLGYVACPEYAKFYDEARPIRYATEKVQFPELEPYVPDPVILDDELDDAVPEALKFAAPNGVATSLQATAVGPSSQLAVPEELNRRLGSIDNNLARLASSLEQLVEILRSK